MRVTYKTITDEQIRQLLAEAPNEQAGFHTVAAWCRQALGEIHLHGSSRLESQVQLADVWNKHHRDEP